MKRLALALLAICLLAALPAAVMAEEDYIFVGGNKLHSGQYLAAGAEATQGEKPESGGYAYYKDGVLELNNYNLAYRGNAGGGNVDNLSVIHSEKELTIELKGSNSLTNTEGKDKTFGIHISDGVDATAENLTVKGEGSLTVTVGDNSNGIFCNGNVDVRGGTLEVKGGGNGILSYDGSISISGGTVTADGGISAYNDLTISGGTVNTEDNLGGENVTIEGGKVEAASIDADTNLTISGGTVNVGDGGISVYGDVTIKGGTVETAGIYAEENITISGGAVEAAKYIDLKGNLTISGGALKIADASTPGLLFADTVNITGGTVEVYGAILAASSINIDPPMQIMTPAGGTVGKYSYEVEEVAYEVITILNPDGTMATEVYIAAVTVPADLPQTGDASRMGLWLALGLMSCAGLIMAKRRTA